MIHSPVDEGVLSLPPAQPRQPGQMGSSVPQRNPHDPQVPGTHVSLAMGSWHFCPRSKPYLLWSTGYCTHRPLNLEGCISENLVWLLLSGGPLGPPLGVGQPQTVDYKGHQRGGKTIPLPPVSQHSLTPITQPGLVFAGSCALPARR